jgi:hypothetical protein
MNNLIIKQQRISSSLDPCGIFDIEVWRKNKKIITCHEYNDVTNEARDNILNVNFYNTDQALYWWVGLIDSTSYVAIAETDTYVNINQVGNGWIEFTNYTDPRNQNSAINRIAWNKNNASTQSISNTTKMLIDITEVSIIKGIFVVGGVVSSQIKNDNSAGNVLWSTALFTEELDLIPGDQIRANYLITI